MADTLADALPREINRVRDIQDMFKSLRNFPGIIVEPQIAMMEADIQAAMSSMANGDVVEMLRAYAKLKDWKV